MGAEPYKKDWLNTHRIRKSYLIINPDSLHGKLLVLRKFLLPSLAKSIMNCLKVKALIKRINKSK
jgi:hypothetical protein